MLTLRKIALHLTFVTISTGIALATSEMIALTVLKNRLALKEFVSCGQDRCVCYTTDPYGFFPIDLTDQKERERFLATVHVPADKEATSYRQWLQENTPHCLPHNIHKRFGGFNPERNKTGIIIGDSFTFGEGVPDQGSIGYLLNEAVPDTNFLNFGVSGQDIRYVKLQTSLIPEHFPDLKYISLVYIYNLNDVIRMPGVNYHENLTTDFENFWSKNLPHKLKSPPTFGECLFLGECALIKLMLLSKINHLESIKTIEDYYNFYLSPENQEGVRSTFAILKEVKELAFAQQEVALNVVIYPLLYTNPEGTYPFTAIHERILQECAVLKINCYDGLDAFKGRLKTTELTVHPIDLHPNEKANRLFVSWLTRLPFMRRL